MDKKQAYDYAFELYWSIFSDLAHFNGNIRGSSSDSNDEYDPELCYFSKLITDAGLACVRMSENFKTFFLMPEPKGSLRDKLADIEKLLNPADYIGRCPEQVETFIANEVRPILDAVAAVDGMALTV